MIEQAGTAHDEVREVTSIPAWLQSILEEHYEEFQMLWELRQQAILDPEYNRADLAELEERIAAHIDGLVLARASSIPMLIVGLAADEAPTVFAAAYVLLELGDVELAQQVLRALEDATAEQREGISQALCHGRIELIDNASGATGEIRSRGGGGRLRSMHSPFAVACPPSIETTCSSMPKPTSGDVLGRPSPGVPCKVSRTIRGQVPAESTSRADGWLSYASCFGSC